MYRVVNVPSDGACLFHCLCIAVNEQDPNGSLLDFKRGIGHFIVRHADRGMNRSTVTYRNAIALEFQVDEDEAPAMYARAMRQADAWGGAIDISAFVDCYDCPVRVYARSDQRDDQLRPLQDFWPIKAQRPLVRLLFDCDHYQLIVRARPRGD